MTDQQYIDLIKKITHSDAVYKYFDMSVLTYNTPQYINVIDRCFAYMFTNIGDTTATVNQMVVFPSATPATILGDSRTVMAHKFDLYAGKQLKLSFNLPIGAAPLIEIVQLYYVDNK